TGDRRGDAGGAQCPQQMRALRHSLGPVRLVEPVVRGLEQPGGVVGDRGGEQRGPGEVEDRVGVRDPLGQRGAGDRGQALGLRHEHPRVDARRRVEADRLRTVLS
ncbi:hypothetical protein ADL26_20625, partial [Thermoactinomyces vulgaris]